MENRNNLSLFFKSNNNNHVQSSHHHLKLLSQTTEESFNKSEIAKKYDIAHFQLDSLNVWQTQALINFHKKGLTGIHLKTAKSFNSLSHLQALSYLHFYEKRNWLESLAILNGANEVEAFAISLGYTYDDVKDLTHSQILLMQKFSHLGLTFSLLRKHAWLNYDKHCDTLDILLTQYGFTIETAIHEMFDLNELELAGIRNRLERKDVKGLNEFQIQALIAYQTAENGLCGEDFQNRAWFNSHAHVKALGHLLNSYHLSLPAAWKELHELTDFQALEINNGKRRQDVFGLTEIQLKILNEMRSNGLTAAHIRGKDWFNSSWHKSVLIYLMEVKKSPLKWALDLIDGLNEDQCFLMQNSGLTRNELLALTPFQIDLLRKFHFSQDERETLMRAKTLLDTESKYLRYIEIYNTYRSHSIALKKLDHLLNNVANPLEPEENKTSCLVM